MPRYVGEVALPLCPFSEGSRSCVGQSLAKIEVLAVLASVLANFKMTLAPEVRMPSATRIILYVLATREAPSPVRCEELGLIIVPK